MNEKKDDEHKERERNKIKRLNISKVAEEYERNIDNKP